MSETAGLVTADELERFPSDDRRYELVAGRIVRMTPVGYPHSRIALQFGSILRAHVVARRLGVVVIELGCKLTSNPDTVRAPDVAFIRQDRLPPIEPKGFWRGAPDLAVEVLSPEDIAADVQSKVEEYLAHDVAVVAVLDPETKRVEIHRPSAPVIRLVQASETLDLGDVIPAFRCPLAEIFE